MNKIYTIIGVFFLVFCFQAGALAQGEDVLVKEITGFVQIQRFNEGEWAEAQEDAVLTSGDRIRSFLKSSALLIFSDGSEFRLRENTSLDIKDVSKDIKDKSAKRELKLNLGSLHYKVPPKKEKATEFKIHSSTSIVGITGTEGVITAKGDGKPSENILMEGATYNTDGQGKDGRYQTKGNIYVHDGETPAIFSAQVDREAKERMSINEEYVTLVKEAVTLYKQKKSEGYNVDAVEIVIKQAFFYLEKRDYDLVKQMVRRTEVLLEKAKKVVVPANLEQKIKDIRKEIKMKEEEGYDTYELYTMFANIQALKQNGYFKRVSQEITGLQQKLALLTKNEKEISFLSHYQAIQLKVMEKEKQGFVLGEIKSTLRQSRMFYEQDDKPKAYQLLNSAQKRLALVLKNVSQSLQKSMDQLKEEIALKKAEAYPTKELELRFEEAKVFIKEEDFLKARESVADIEARLLTLSRGVSADWKLKINEIKNDIAYKKAMGYDVNKIYGDLGTLEDYEEQGDPAKLEALYSEMKNALSRLKLPTGFDKNWKAFLKKKKAREDLGFDIREVDSLNEKIELAAGKGDITSARLFLEKAEELLVTLKDQEPPKVQVLSVEEEDGLITLEGYAGDNTTIKNVSVNHYVVDLSKDGKFTFKTVPTRSLKELSVHARDMRGNVSAPVIVKLQGQYTAEAVEGKITDAEIVYSDDTFTVKGKFAAGGRVKVADVETFCDSQGKFAVMIDPRQTRVGDSVTVTGFNNGNMTGEEIVLNVEDKWVPEIKIKKLVFNDTFVPALEMDPLAYKEHSVTVSGRVDVKQMVNIEGKVTDIGGGMESLEAAGLPVDIRENGAFNASMAISPSDSDLFVSLTAKDKAGNTAQKDAALDVTWKIPRVTVNSEQAFLSSSGAFVKDIVVKRKEKDILVALANAKGEIIMSKRLPVADLWPPELEIQDIRYEENKVLIVGRTSSDATVSDIRNTLFAEPVQAVKNVSFTLTADYPAVEQNVTFVAINIEGKTSEEITLTLGPPKDNQAPVLYVSKPRYEKNQIIIDGFVEDDSKMKSLTVQGAAVPISDQGHFSHKLESKDITSIEIIATDATGNKAKEIIALIDKEPPQIVINTWEAKNGRLIIAGEVNDNIAVKEVRLNDMPIARGKDTPLAFSYDGALTESSKNAVIVALDLLNNQAKEGPRALEIPVDTIAPTGKSMSMRYGSPIIYASGQVDDPAGIRAVYVNGDPVELFDDGTYSIKVSIDVDPPGIMLEAPSYDNGKVVIDGKVSLGGFSPSKIVVESEDLSGNRGVIFNQEVRPYTLNELEVIINGSVVVFDEGGSIHYEQPIVLGQRIMNVQASDPFDNRSTRELELEGNVPFVEVQSLEYRSDDQLVILTGQARDEESGLYTVAVNGIRVDFDSADGSFSYTGNFEQQSLNVVVTDNIGNVTSMTKQVDPPDIWPPVFSLEAAPVPAIIGNPVNIEITSLDSRTRLPEVLNNAPVVTANLNGTVLPLAVQGEGVNYIAILETAGLDPALVTVQVEGEDASGNRSTQVEGTNVFALIAEDTISPSFTFELAPSPLVLGNTSTVNVYASEDLRQPPALEVVLPSGTVSIVELVGVNAGQYKTSLTVDVAEGLGDVLLRLNGGEDLSGNAHGTTEETVGVVAPAAVSDLPLNIHLIEFLPGKFTISGQTASEAMVQIEVGSFLQNIVADAQGLFTFERQVMISELEDLHSKAKNILVSLKAHNYAGFESPRQTFDVPLPPVPEQGSDNFIIQLQPSPVGQGGLLNINVEVLRRMPQPPRGLLYLPDGARVPIDLQGQGTLTGQYRIPEDAALGPAAFEVVAGDIRGGLDFDIALSTEWMQRLNKNEFFSIHASPDPLLVGDEVQFVVETLGDLRQIPRLQIMLPDGQVANIPLQGSLRRFQGRYQSRADMLPGRAELVLNPGTPEEIRRPYGIEERTSEDGQADIFLFANPNPLFGGEPYEVSVSLSRNIDFIPKLILRFRDGRGIDIPLSGDVPSNKFEAQGTLPNDVGTGLARFVLLDDRGLVMDRFPANVSAPITSSAGMDIFVVPDMLRHLNTATIQLNSIGLLPDDIVAHVNYPDGSKTIIPLTGGETVRQGIFTVPDHVPAGVMTITLFDDNNNTLGSARAQVIEEDHGGGLVQIHLDNPDFGPSQTVRMGVESNWPLNFVPRASLIWDGGSRNIPLNGRIPGNRFRGQFTAPAEPLNNARFEIQDNQGNVIADLSLDRRPAGEGDVMVTPMPPVIGEPLSIKVTAPSAVNSAPTMRLIYKDGSSRELNAYGAIPGNIFMASLDQLKRPLQRIEIIHDGNIVASIPVEHLAMRELEFFIDPVGELAPCALTDFIVRTTSDIPFIPQISVDFQGKIVEMPLSQLSPTELRGRLQVPCDVSLNNVNVRVFDPQGGLLWQRMYSQTEEHQGLYLNIMPVGQRDVQLEWHLLRGIDAHEIRYGKTAALAQRIVNRGAIDRYYLSNLDPGQIYFFQVAALKGNREIMVSDIMQATVGAVTRELHVYEYINGSNVHLVWDEYPGADGYRVGWGNTPGSFANTFNVAATDFFVPGLAVGNMYYMKVFALAAGEIIGESREIFVPLQAFQSAGGDIYVTPDPPAQGQDLQINIHSFNDLPFIPNIVVHLQNGDVELTETGFGRDFTATLAGGAFTSPLNAIDVYDSGGAHMFGRPFTGTGGGYGGPSLPIFTTPDPPAIGYDLNVRVEFPNPVSFLPSLFIEFASETRQYAFPVSSDNRIFETTITGSVITSSVIRIWVEGPNGQFLGDRFFGGGGGGPGFEDPPFVVTPEPLIIGSPVNMELDVGEVISQTPILRIHFDGGSMQEVSMFGATPGQFFTYNIASLTSMINSIDIVNPATQVIEHTWWPGSYGGGPQSCDIIILSEDPPVFGQPLDVRAVFPQALSYVPTLFVDFENGPRTYSFPQAPGLYVYERALPIGEMNSPVHRIEIRDEFGNTMCDRGPWGSEFQITVLTVNPDPPVIGQDVQIHVEFNAPVPFTPRWRFFSISGPLEGSFSQGPGLSVYDYTVPGNLITLYPTDLEIMDDNNNELPGGELFFVNDANFTCTVDFDPFPPVPFTNLTITVNYEAGSFPSYIPSASMEFAGGGGYSQAFTQPAGVGFYQMTIAAGVLTDNISILGIGNSATGSIDCGEDFEGGGEDVDLILDPDPPLVNQPLTVTANFLHPTPFVPRLVLEYYGAPDKEYIFPGGPGQVTYQFTVPIGDMQYPIARIAVEDPQGVWIPDDLLFAAPAALDYPHNLFTQTTGNSGEIKIFWDIVSGAAGYKVYYGTSSQTYNTSGSPDTIADGSTTQFIITGLNDNTQYFITVEAYDAQSNESNSPEEVAAFPGTGGGALVSAPAIVSRSAAPGNNIAQQTLTLTNNGATAANVRFQTNPLFKEGGGGSIPPSNYTITPAGTTNIAASGNANFDVNLFIPGGATAGTYNGTVTFFDDADSDAFLDTGESFVDVDVDITVTGGGGSLSPSPTTITDSVSAGGSISQVNMAITNNGTSAVDIRFVTPTVLTRNGGGGNIPPGNYTITPPVANSVAASGGQGNFTIDLDVPGGTTAGDYSGTLTFYGDANTNSIFNPGTEDSVVVTVDVTVAPPVDHIHIQSDTNSSTMGNPIIVTLKAHDSGHNKIDTYENDVTIMVSELTSGEITGSWHLSTNDGPKGPDTSTVAMYGGLGIFTVDALEPENLNISVTGISTQGGPLNLEFLPNNGSTFMDLAIIGPNRAPTGVTGTTVWIAAVDSAGQVDPSYTGTVNFSAAGDGLNTPVILPPLSHTFVAGDNGQYQVTISDVSAEKVTFTAQDTGNSLSTNFDIDFVGVTKYLAFGPNQSGPNFSKQGTTMKFTLRAADSANNVVRSYNNTATFTRLSDPTNDAFLSGSNTFQFVDGIAEIILNNNQSPETVTFIVDENTDPAIDTGTLTADFQSTDSTAPEIVRVEMDTPWIVHVYFNEDVDSVTAGNESNYTGAGTVDKVCWYGDNVTLNLAALPGTLGSTFNLTIDGVQDTTGNAMSSVAFNNILIPNVDFQGAAGPVNDWFEIQASNTNPAAGETVLITIYHKNVCGYLTGSNQQNANSTGLGSVTINYVGESSRLDGSQPSSVDLSSGSATFEVTVAASPPPGSVTISATGGSPVVNTTQILALTIP